MHRHRRGVAAAILNAAVLLAAALPPAASSDTLRALWSHPTGRDLPLAAEPDRNGRPFLYVALKSGGVQVIEIGAGAPRVAATLGRAGFGGADATGVFQDGAFLHVALGDHFAAFGARPGIAVVDVREPRRPRVVSLWQAESGGSGASGVLAAAGVAYLAAMREGVLTFRVEPGGQLRRIGRIRPDPNFPRADPSAMQRPAARGLALRGDRLFVAYDAGGLRAVDVSDPAAPREIGRHIAAGMGRKPQAYNAVVLDGDRAYAATDYCGVEIVAIRDPRAMRTLGRWNPWRCETPANNWRNSGGHTNQMAYDAGRRRLFVSGGDTDLAVLDVADPALPRLAAQHGRPRDGRGTWGLASREGIVFLLYIRTAIPFRGDWSGIEALAWRDGN